jgi:FKBP-type peptidyl-prolyl cis-trans isomerase SlyD
VRFVVPLPAMSTETIQPNTFVTLAYVLKSPEGDVLDQSSDEDGEPIRYVHGYGMLVPGLEAALVGLKAGDKKDVVVPAEDGFGDRDDELVLEIDRTDFPDPPNVKPGDEFVAESPDGDEVVMRVAEVKGDSVVVDANHPLAGITLHYSVEVQEVREATEEEIMQAAEDLDDAHEHVHGPDCDHDHAHGGGAGGEGVLQLGKKPN